jgi:Fe-S oxidoreductase
MLDYKAIEKIKNYGAYKDTGEGRIKVLRDDIGYRMDEKADYVIIGGCLLPEAMPHAFKALKEIMEKLKISYAMLSTEYCCGWAPLGQPAVMAKNEEDIGRAREIARDFILKNFKQAEELGAHSIAIFCAACEPNYSNYRHETSLEIISYMDLLNRFFDGGKLNMEADYYAGCYRFRRKITNKPLNLKPARQVLSKIEGLKINYLDSNLCCYIPPHMGKLIDSLKSRTIITICSGCYSQLKNALKDKGNFQIKMLPEIVAASTE